VLALDCEMVQTVGNSDSLARVSIVNYNGHSVYDKFVKPESRVTDFRTWVSGVTPQNLREENGAISEL
jgi:RNA exonuclease 4